MMHSQFLYKHKTASTLKSCVALADLQYHHCTLISCVHLCTVSALVQCAFKKFHWKHASLMRLLSVITQHECSVADRWDFIYPPQSEQAFRSRWIVITRQHLKVLAYRTEVPNIRPELARQTPNQPHCMENVKAYILHCILLRFTAFMTFIDVIKRKKKTIEWEKSYHFFPHYLP